MVTHEMHYDCRLRIKFCQDALQIQYPETFDNS